MACMWPCLLWKLCLVLATVHLSYVLGKNKRKASTWIAPRPHIIMIVADDLGWDDVSFHGSPQIPTPHIDKLANSGVILNSYYVSPICTPTRASLMTGKHPINLGVQHATIFGTQAYGLPLGEVTTPQYLKSLGYRTHGVGKWHLGFFEKEYTPTYRGFETFYGFWNGKDDYWDHSSLEDVWGIDLRDNMKAVRNETGHYGTELFSEVAERIIDTHNTSEPLYLYLAQQGVHSANGREPLQAPKRLLDKFPHFSSEERRIYAAMVASLDESVGNITKALKRSGLYDNSVIVFTTDNGGAPRGFNWNQGCNYPFKGGKDTFWEGGVRGVGFVHSKLIRKKGRVSYDLIDVTDWLPTFYHLAGGDVTKIQERIDGLNVWETIAYGKKSPRTEVLHNIDPIRKFAAIRVGSYKLIVNQDAVFKTTWHPRYDVKGELDTLPQPSTVTGAVINCGTWSKSKEAVCNTDNFPCLFNIKKDPCEYRNLAHTHLDIVERLLHKLLDYQKKARPVWFPERDPTANPSKNGTIGFWGPWRSSTANKIILDNVLDSIPSVSGKKHSCCKNGKSNGKKMGKVFSTHGDSDKEVYLMLEKILRMTKEGKKGQIPRNSKLMKESLAMLYTKMKQKTKVDDLMHKLQMIKKGRVAKRKGHKPLKHVKEQTRSSTLTQMNSSLESRKPKKFTNKNHQTVDKTGTRRTEIENVPIRDDNSINDGADNTLEMRSDPREDDQDMEEAPSWDTSSGSEQVEPNDLENGELMADNNENERNTDTEIEDEYDTEVESSGLSAETNPRDQTSEEKSEMEFQGSDSISDDFDNDNDNDDDNGNGHDNDNVNDDDNGNDIGNDDFIRDNSKISDMYF